MKYLILIFVFIILILFLAAGLKVLLSAITGAFSTILGIAILFVLVIIVIWMFIYASKRK